MANKNKIGIDCRLSGIKHAGIGRYTINLIARLPIIAQNKKDKIEWHFFFNNHNQISEFIEKYVEVKGDKKGLDKIITHIVKIKHYSLKEQLKLPKVFQSYNLDIVHVPHFNSPIFYQGKISITIHDLLWHQRKGFNVTTLNPFKYAIKYLGYRQIVKQAINKASLILVPAKTIKKTILNYYPDVKDKIIITHEGVDQRFHLTNNVKFTNKQFKSKQLIYTGSLYPHKNINLILQALTQLPEYKLKIIGNRSVFLSKIEDQVKQLNIENQVKFTGFLSDKELIKEYQQSLALIQPSLSEGFGLTGLEALTVGLPILISDIPIFQEIYKDIPLYFDPNSIKSFIIALKNLKKKRAQTMIKKGQKLIKNYSWDKMSQLSYKHIIDLVR